ncbi:Polynucleotide 3'-phosphatase ZDP [Vitis vinifera]|uniref:Polynucleotide 3'-phosphatase ZDP n=1 Tax=Vitis vinifera TaxID=29760 RepID=A0A438J4W3_VITVI|nr:Polynucleotide 3'-phosphatase ZDP [Vitis vinifera]
MVHASISNFCTLTRYPSFSTIFSLPQYHIPSSPLRISKGLYCFCVEKTTSMSSSSSSKVVVEYAKSNRSSCKTCSKTISANAVRLGLVTRGARGFDMTKWHHVHCFSAGSESISSAEMIQGFASLKIVCFLRGENVSFVSHSGKCETANYGCVCDVFVFVSEMSEELSSDQEALKKLVDGFAKSLDEVLDEGKDLTEGSKELICEELGVHKRDEDEKDKREERDSKKTKMSAPALKAEQEIAFAVSDIKDKYKDATLLPKWKAFQTVIFLERDDDLHDSKKIAAFDFDGCLAKTSVKRVGPDAWSLMYPSIPDKLQSLYNDGYKLVIFTNESNIERWKNKRQVAVDSKIGRLNNFIKCVKVPIQVFISCGFDKSDGQAEDPFRKPKPGMWRIMEQHFNSGISIDMDQSFYVGDAAGRLNDHSDADIKFAQAIGLKFYVPEEYFDANFVLSIGQTNTKLADCRQVNGFRFLCKYMPEVATGWWLARLAWLPNSSDEQTSGLGA